MNAPPTTAELRAIGRGVLADTRSQQFTPSAFLPPAPPSPPEMGFLARTRLPAPYLPLDAFGPWWAGWIKHAAAGANAPPDYVAIPLLAAASALIGNARWARGWHGWSEPPALWCASVGNPSSGKSPGAAPVMREVLGMVETYMARNYPDEIAAWKESAKVAELIEKQWEKDVAVAVKKGEVTPAKPREAAHRPAPVRPRVRVADATVEALATGRSGWSLTWAAPTRWTGRNIPSRCSYPGLRWRRSAPSSLTAWRTP